MASNPIWDQFRHDLEHGTTLAEYDRLDIQITDDMMPVVVAGYRPDGERVEFDPPYRPAMTHAMLWIQDKERDDDTRAG